MAAQSLLISASFLARLHPLSRSSMESASSRIGKSWLKTRWMGASIMGMARQFTELVLCQLRFEIIRMTRVITAVRGSE